LSDERLSGRVTNIRVHPTGTQPEVVAKSFFDITLGEGPFRHSNAARTLSQPLLRAGR
jgi:hypothetical protein